MSDTERFAEMVDKAYDALHRLYHARGHICSQGCRAADWGSAKITLEAAGVPDLLAENERLRAAIGSCAGFITFLRDEHWPPDGQIAATSGRLLQEIAEVTAVPDDDRSEEVAGGS